MRATPRPARRRRAARAGCSGPPVAVREWRSQPRSCPLRPARRVRCDRNRRYGGSGFRRDLHGSAVLLEVELVEELAPLAVLLLGGTGELQRAALDVDDLGGDFGLEGLRHLLQSLGMDLRVGVFLESRENRRRAAYGAAVAGRLLNALAVVVVGAALVGHEHARQHRGRAAVGAGARLIQRALLLLDLLEARAPPLAVGRVHLVAEIRVVAVDGVDHAGIALAD